MIKWNAPKDIWRGEYGSISFALSGDGSVYWGMIGTLENHPLARGFAYYVFRQEGDNVGVPVALGENFWHAWLVKEVNALYVVGFDGNGSYKNVKAVAVPGYVPTNQENLSNIPTPTLPAVSQTADLWARDRLKAMEDRVETSVRRTREVTDQLRHHLENHPQMTVDYDGLINNALHAFWARFPDRLYVEIQDNLADPNRPLTGLIKHVAQNG